MNELQRYIKLFSCCIPVKGANRSILCDLQRRFLKFIPNALFDLIPFFDSLEKGKIILLYGCKYKNIVTGYIDFLIENEFAFYCSKEELECFPPMNISEFEIPFPISNAIIEIDDCSTFGLKHIINELNSVLCPAVELRIQKKIDITCLEMLVSFFDKAETYINEINIVLIESGFDIYRLKELFWCNLRLSRLIIGEAMENKSYNDFCGDSQIIFSTHQVNLPSNCGIFSSNSFVTNLSFFTESQNHNTCLNRKVAIDKDGNIKNCPSMNQSFGNIKETKLKNVLKNEKFTAKWNIKKDEIAVCKDCEFRHVCMDCRAYLEDPGDIYSKPLKCGYNPYTTEWEDCNNVESKINAKLFYHFTFI